MDLVKLDSTIPIKAIPKENLDKIILNDFIVWLSDLLGLTDETSAKRLYLSIEAIKTACWSMGFAEIKKMFELYADSKLSIKPIPNYFDRILLGKIIDAYKEQKIVEKKEPDPIKDMEETNRIHLYKFFKGYFVNGRINDCYVNTAYKWLDENGFLVLSKEEKLKLMQDAEVMIILDKKENGNLKEKLGEFKKESIPKEEKVFQAKKLALQAYLKKVTEETGKEIEKKLKQ